MEFVRNKTCGECRFHDKDDQCSFFGFTRPACLGVCRNFQQLPSNGDKIRQMSNEELAIEFATVTDCGNCDDCPVKDYCTTECCDPTSAWVAYFNAPAESEGEDE